MLDEGLLGRPKGGKPLERSAGDLAGKPRADAALGLRHRTESPQMR
jgi:hypothetical protein